MKAIITPQDARWRAAVFEAEAIVARTIARYPWTRAAFATVPTVTQQVANYVQTTLASGITNAAGTMTVVSAAGFPTSGNFMVLIKDQPPATTFEWVEVTAVAGAVLTITRGQEGSTGIAHIAGAAISNDLTSAMLLRAFPWGWLGQFTQTTPDQAITAGTLTDITGLSGAVTIGANRRIKFSVTVPATSSVADGQLAIFIVDVTAGTTIAEFVANQVNTASVTETFGGDVTLVPPASGSRTYKAQIQRINGTGTVTVKNTFQQGSSLLIEDVGQN